MNVPEGFSPAGLKVLVVDDDPVCLVILETMLRQCSYIVTKCQTAAMALSRLRENRSAFDLVISDVHMPDMDGFQLLEAIGLELDLPVIMMSANGETGVVMKGIIHGACDYLLKPVRIEELRNIWQHVVRRRGRGGDTPKDEQQAREWDEAGRGLDSPGEADSVSRKRKEKLGSLDEPLEDGTTLKKARVVWSMELHQQFVNAVNQLGIDKAVPKRILEIMNVQGLSRENVASHLQKYRQYLKRLSGVSTQPYPVASFQAAQEGSFAGTMQIQPGGRGVAAAASSSAKGMNIPLVGSGLVEGLSRIDPATLSTLAQLRAHQQHQQFQGGAVASQRYGGGVNQWHVESPSGPGLSPTNAPPNMAFAGLQRMSSSELDMLMRVAQQDSLARQRQESSARDDVSVGVRSPVFSVPLAPTGLSVYKREDDLDIGLAQVAVVGADTRTVPPYATIAHDGSSQDKISDPAYDFGVGDFDAAPSSVQNAPSEIGVSILNQAFPRQPSDAGLRSFMPSSPPELHWSINNSDSICK